MPRHGVEDLTYPIPRPGKPGRGTQGGPDGLAHGVAGDSASGAADLNGSGSAGKLCPGWSDGVGFAGIDLRRLRRELDRLPLSVDC